jgi:hypothetical protein
MLCKAKVAVCCKIHTKHINSMWAPSRIFQCSTWWCVKLPLGFKGLNKRLKANSRTLDWTADVARPCLKAICQGHSTVQYQSTKYGGLLTVYDRCVDRRSLSMRFGACPETLVFFRLPQLFPECLPARNKTRQNWGSVKPRELAIQILPAFTRTVRHSSRSSALYVRSSLKLPTNKVKEITARVSD